MPAFSWTTDPKEAELEQQSLRDLVELETALSPDCVFSTGLAIGTGYDENSKQSLAVGVLFDSKGRPSKAFSSCHVEVDFPYVPGLLAFRVGPAVCALLDEIRVDEIDLLVFDGQGIAHKRGLGLASHIGVLYNKPSIGVTRNNLFGNYANPPGGRFESTDIRHPRNNQVIGKAVRLALGCDPCYLSPGHMVSIDDALLLIQRITPQDACFPQPLQKAHTIANAEARRLWRV